ncbi:MAG: WhiB family transcriptional regulator [Micropruina sp.]|nr:WhiB family transcriptional regulator [Micropruina sp.]
MTHSIRSERAACIDDPAVFQHQLLEEPTQARRGAENERALTLLTARAAAVCDDCPLFRSCLYEAVVDHDVAGFAAGTTPAQRTQLRLALGVKVEPEDFDAFAGVVRGARQLNHDEVVRLRQANPHESLETLAMRLGCSLSTVKRHMRRAREASGEVSLTVVKPTMERVLAAYATVVGAPRRRRVQRVA